MDEFTLYINMGYQGKSEQEWIKRRYPDDEGDVYVSDVGTNLVSLTIYTETPVGRASMSPGHIQSDFGYSEDQAMEHYCALGDVYRIYLADGTSIDYVASPLNADHNTIHIHEKG
jgi:hypothetical protein